MNSVFDQVCYACIPAESLPVLAELRCEPGVRVALAGERAWVRWEPGNEALLIRLLAVPGVAFYRFRDGLWYCHGQYLPSFGLPDDMPTQRLDQVLTPAPVRTEPFTKALVQPKQARLVLDQQPRRTSAVLCHLTELASWANRATSRTLASIQAARWPEKGAGTLTEEIVLVRPEEVQIVSGGALQPLTRSAIRLALGEEV